MPGNVENPSAHNFRWIGEEMHQALCRDSIIISLILSKYDIIIHI